MAGPPSSLVTDLDREFIFQKFGVDYEDLPSYVRLNTTGNHVRILHFRESTLICLL